jgi:hypothetical protein
MKRRAWGIFGVNPVMQLSNESGNKMPATFKSSVSSANPPCPPCDSSGSVTRR